MNFGETTVRTRSSMRLLSREKENNEQDKENVLSEIQNVIEAGKKRGGKVQKKKENLLKNVLEKTISNNACSKKNKFKENVLSQTKENIEYLSKTEDSKETKENTDELEETQVTSMLSPMPPSGLVSLDGEQDLTPVKETGRRRKGQQMALVAVARERVWVGRDAAGRKHSIKETVDTIEETLVVPMMRRGTQTAVQIDPQCSISYPLMLEDGKSLDLKPEAIYQQLKDSPVTADKLLDLLASDDQLTKVFIEKISNRLTPSTTVSLAIDMLHQAKEKM